MATRWLRSTLLLVVMLAMLANAIANDSNDSNAADANAALARKEHVLRTHMSTKTMYPAPTDAQLAQEHALDSLNAAASATCRPVQLNFVVRHGTRFPTIKDIDRIAATRAKLQARGAWPGRDGEDDDWSSHRPYDRARAGWLAPAGVFEQISLGERLRARFGGALGAHYAREAFVFEHTYKPRTQQSAMGFAFGFFGGTQPVHYAYDPVGQDHELRFFDNCPAFDRQIETNKTATAHHAAYRSSRQMERNLRAFQRRAGDATLTQKHLEAAYAGCAFDVAVHGEFSEWCALLDEPTLLSMDYFQDLKHFYKKSHGHAIAFEIAAPLLQDIHGSMRARVDGRSRVEGHFRFAHAETILPLASLLNLSYFDRHLSDREGHFLANTPLDVATRRPFRGSVLAPFSANIGFVLYECEAPDGSSGEPTFRVQTLLHERTVWFPDCGGEALCPFDTFEKMFSQWIHEYDFFAQCTVE